MKFCLTARLRPLSISLLLLFNFPCHSEILFDEASQEMGLTWPKVFVSGQAQIEVYNVSWPDFNADGYPDLWISSHHFGGAKPQLWINQQGKGFKNIITKNLATTDLHSGSWGDFDNDGDPDLFLAAGSGDGNITTPKMRTFYVNENQALVDRATAYGLNPARGSGRGAMWFDYNKDGRLDLMQFNQTLNANADFPSNLFSWQSNKYTDVTKAVGIELNPDIKQSYDTAHFGIISDLYGDGIPDYLMLDGQINNPGFITRIYRNEKDKLHDITSQLPVFDAKDAIVADFNGDAIPDIFAVNGGSVSESNIYYPTDSGYLVAQLISGKKNTTGINFKTAGKLTVQCSLCPKPIFIGSSKVSPSGLMFNLDSNDPTSHGVSELTNAGTYIGFDVEQETWFLYTHSPLKTVNAKNINITTSSLSFSDIKAIGFNNRTNPRTSSAALMPVYLEYHPETGQYTNRAKEAGLNKMIGYGLVAGDFDNDMDIDVLVRQSAPLTSTPYQNVYIENQGDGTFKEADDLKGATLLLRGPGAEIYDFSRVATAVADYNADGFLDIYTSAGEYKMMDNRYYTGMPPRLFKNRANNGNHWLEIDLQGTISNRDAIGAKVLANTPDGKTQLRMQDGGNHYSGQDQHRLHFGLGSNSTVNSIVVTWPTGNVQTISNVSADQILRIFEQPTNQAPVNTVPNSQTIDDTQALIFSSENNNLISIADVDAGNYDVKTTLTLTDKQGILTVTNTQGVTINGNGTQQVEITGTVDKINTALIGLTFTPESNHPGIMRLQITTNDFGHTGTDPGLTGTSNSEEDTDLILITINDLTPPTTPDALLDSRSETESVGDGITTDTTPTITGHSAESGNTITAVINAQSIITTVAEDGTWNITPDSELIAGNYEVKVTETDSAGNISLPATLYITITTSEPANPVETIGSIEPESSNLDPSTTLPPSTMP